MEQQPNTSRGGPIAVSLGWLLVFVAVPSLLALLARQAWWLELFCHFREYYLAACVIGLGATLRLRLFRHAVGFACLALINAWIVAPLWLAPAPARARAPGEPPLKLLNLNVHRNNPQRTRVVRYLEASGADLLVLQELNTAWGEALQAGLHSYEPALVELRDGTSHFGIGLFVRRGGPLTVTSAKLFYPDPSLGHPAIAATLRAGSRSLQLLGIHVHPPLSPYTAFQRRTQLRSLAEFMAERSGARVLMGDSNLTAFSPLYDDLMRVSGLRDARQGHGLPWTWYRLPWLPLGLSIDICLHSDELRVDALRIGPDVNSDHRPLRVDLSWTDPPPG